MTLGTLRTAVAAELGLDNTAASSDQLLIDQWLNQGVRDILLKTHCYVASTTQAIVAGTTDYQIASTVLAIIDLNGSVAGGRFEYVTSEELFEMRRLNASLRGTARAYAVLGSNLLTLYPTPSASETLTLYYVPKPTEMTAAGNDPSTTTYGAIPVEFHRALELYAFWSGASYDSNKESKYGESYHRDYEVYLAKTMRPAISRKGGSRLPRVRIGGRHSWARATNDIY